MGKLGRSLSMRNFSQAIMVLILAATILGVAGASASQRQLKAVPQAKPSSGSSAIQVASPSPTVPALPPLSIIPSSGTVAGQSTTAFFGFNGKPFTTPGLIYKFSLQSCPGGSIQNGEFLAPAINATCIVTVTDASGATASATIIVQAPLVLAPAFTSLSTFALFPPIESGTMSYYSVGGTPPYKFSMSGGCPANSLYVSPSQYASFNTPVVDSTCTLTVQDSAGTSVSRVIYFAGGRTGYVYSLYDTLLQRSPAPSETAGWLSAITSANLSCSQLAGDFLNSPEFQAKNLSLSNLDYVLGIYSALLNRSPLFGMDPSYNVWVDGLNNKTITRQHVADGFLQSAEFNSDCQLNYGFPLGAGVYSPLAIMSP